MKTIELRKFVLPALLAALTLAVAVSPALTVWFLYNMPFTTTNGLRKLSATATGAAAQELEANWTRLGVRYAEALNPKGYGLDGTAFGATGDGSTNDTTALQNAITAAVSAGVPLYIPGGTYIVSASLSLPSNAHVYGIGRVTLKLAASSNVPIFTNSDTTNGNSGIVLQNLICDGNLANQAQTSNADAFSVIYLIKVTDSRFLNLDVSGGYRHGTFPTVSARGEGIELIQCNRCLVQGGYYHDNTYDGIKLRGGSFNAIDGVFCRDNGRSGIQLAYQGTATTADAEKYTTLTNVNVEHSTGTPSAAAPQTSGVYFHSASYCTLNGLSAYGVQQGIGAFDNAIENACSNLLIRHRQNSEDYAIDLGEDATCHRWAVSNFTVSPVSGSAPKLIRLANNYHTVTNGRVSVGSGTGTATIVLTGNNHLLTNINAQGGSVSLSDTSTGSTAANNMGL